MLDVFKKLTYQVISPKASARARYENFRELLKNDQLAHEYLAELEEIYQQPPRRDINYVCGQYTKLAQAVSTMVSCLGRLAPDATTNLRAYYKKINFYCRFALAPPEIVTSPPFLLPLKGRYQNDLQVGGKAFHLAQLKTDLALPVPEGFIITTSAYQLFLLENGLHEKIAAILADIDIFAHDTLHGASKQLYALIDQAVLPAPLEEAMEQACQDLTKTRGKNVLLAVRSSAVGEDSETSFAGQYSSILNTDCQTLSQAYREVIRSKFSPEALYYRTRHGFHDHSTPMAVMVLEMIDADLSGVMDSHEDKSTSIHVVKGQGAGLMAGEKSSEITLTIKNGAIQTSGQDDELLSQNQVSKLCAWAVQINSFYQSPQEIEWCLDQNGNFFILQSRFLPTQSESKVIKKTGDLPPPLFTGGEVASHGVASGKVFILHDLNQTDEVPDKAVLITETIPPALSLICHRLAAVIAVKGSVASHFTSIAREFNIPCLVKTDRLTEILTSGQEVTLDTAGQAVYPGRIDNLLNREKKTTVANTNPLKKNMGILISFISPLRLIDPAADTFAADSCRSFHDIIRFCHETGLQAMFGLAKAKPLRKGGARLLRSELPLQLYLLDIEDGLTTESKKNKEVTIADIRSRPLLALWEGLSHPDIKWRDRDHFDWGACDEVIMAGGVVNPKSIIFASYGVISRDYLNLNMRFGYHFAILDSLCGEKESENYVTLRFAGGGGGMDGKTYRLMMIEKLLGHFGFIINSKGDLLDARLTGYDRIGIMEALDMCGRLLGATRLMDMILRNEDMVDQSVEEFLDGRYDFSNE